MKKYVVYLLITTLIFSAFSLCLNNNSNFNLKDYSNKFIFYYNNTPIEVPLRATIGEAKEVKLINTNDKEIYNYYHNTKLIYIRGSLNITPEEGGVSIIDLITKLAWLNSFYPHNIIIELKKDRNITAKVIFANGTKKITYFTPMEVYLLTHNNKTMAIEIYKRDYPAMIVKEGNKFIIMGNSTKELDKAESRFIIDILVGDINNVVVS
ncbi:hypothetical protein ACPB8Q_01335 [Methanocaldococcus indicus]|uniref:hypothetical protein n=1 Tax=Methanocaldococcus indicus TaxID=213231 RepID=UPI003C6D954E